MRYFILSFALCIVIASPTLATLLKGQDFDDPIFATGVESEPLHFNRTGSAPVTHASTGGTDLGFTHDGLISTSGGTPGTDVAAGVIGGEFHIIHYSSTYTGSTLDFEENPRTGSLHFESVDLTGFKDKTFSMDIHDIGSNTTDDDVVVRLLVNGTTTITLLDTRPQPNGTAGSQTLTHAFSDMDISARLLIDILSDDNGDGYGFDNISFEGNVPDTPAFLSNTEHYRLIWDNDPSSTATVAWKQISGANGTVYYGTEDFGRAYTNYPSQKTVDSTGAYRGGEINTCFARLSGLQPDTAYYFVVKDDAGVSPRYWFLTAPDSPKPFTFIAGGDSRSNHTPRRKANRMVAKLRPLFVVFTGDMINIDDASSWNTWFEHWQETISSDGRMYPLIPHRGNHENGGNNNFFQLFDTTAENYYAFSVGGNLLRFYVLNSETTEGGDQATWLGSDLTTNAASHTHLAAGYHKPMRPHNSAKSEGNNEYDAWAQLFYYHGMDLVFEADSHTVKRTWPIKPFTGAGSDEDFIRDDTNGTVFTGEGCWGAPLRASDDPKDWTRDADMLNSFDWVHVYPSYMEFFTVKVDNSDDVGNLQEGDVFSLPSAIDLWNPANGARVVVNNHGATDLKSYAQWQFDQWGAGTIPTNTEALADFDGDGYNNLTEFSHGLDPKVPAAAGAGVLPVIAVEGSNQIGINYRRETDTSLTYVYEFSIDLITWNPMAEGTDYTQTTSPDGDNEQVEIQLIGDKASTLKGFIRIKFGIL